MILPTTQALKMVLNGDTLLRESAYGNTYVLILTPQETESSPPKDATGDLRERG